MLLESHLGKDTAGVAFNGPRLDKQFLGDGCVVKAACHAVKYLALPLGQLGEECAFRGTTGAGQLGDDRRRKNSLAFHHGITVTEICSEYVSIASAYQL